VTEAQIIAGMEVVGAEAIEALTDSSARVFAGLPQKTIDALTVSAACALAVSIGAAAGWSKQQVLICTAGLFDEIAK
jgi:hypothetical protein